MRQPVLIGDRLYPTKAAAGAAVKIVLYRYPPGARVSAVDEPFLAHLVARHPKAAIKVGCGIDHFEVRLNWTTPGFWIVRQDGTETDFSYLECLTPSSHAENVRGALRLAVANQVIEFRNQELDQGTRICPVLNIPLTAGSCHVDHAEPTFAELAERFVEICGGYGAITIADTQDGRIGARLVDFDLTQKWQDFHLTHAKLRLVSAEANTGILRRNRK